MHALPPFEIQHARVVAGEGTIREQSSTPFSWSGTARNRAAATAELSFAYFLGWEVRVDGSVVTASVERTGLMRFPLPPGEHSIIAEWKSTPPRYMGELLSLFLLLACVPVLRKWRLRTSKAPQQSVHDDHAFAQFSTSGVLPGKAG
jgi:hypothetical protein